MAFKDFCKKRRAPRLLNSPTHSFRSPNWGRGWLLSVGRLLNAHKSALNYSPICADDDQPQPANRQRITRIMRRLHVQIFVDINWILGKQFTEEQMVLDRRTASIRRPGLPKSRVPPVVAQRHTIAEPNFGKKSRNWLPTAAKQHHQFVTKESNSALRERETGSWRHIQLYSTNVPSSFHVQNLSRSFEECPRVTRVQHATAWRRARSEKFVEEEEEEEEEAETDNQSARLQFEGVRYCPPPPPRRPRHAHLQRFFRSADAASASSTTTTATNGSITGCGGCSSTVSGNSSSTTMPTMEEGRRMAACWRARKPTNRLYRSVDDDYGGRDQRDRRRGVPILNDHRRLLPDVPTKMPKKSQGQFPPASFVPRLSPYTMPPPYSYRIPSVQRADPSPLARFNSLNRAKPLRRDFSVDRRTESLFRHFVRPDPFEIL
uniref:Uncharacterized protein n=1 Tax=Globodera rostochiensis TaxID=31243 RepID=A0A914GY14_GLORO